MATDTSRTLPAENQRTAVDRVRQAYRSPWLFTLVLLAMAGDVITTTIGLELGLREANPVVAGTIETYGVLGMVTLKTLTVGILLSLPLLSARPRLTFRACCGCYAAICWLAVASNVVHIVVVA